MTRTIFITGSSTGFGRAGRMREQLLSGGLRLTGLLNAIFK